MKKKPTDGFDKDILHALHTDPAYAAEYFDELSRRPLPVQVALLRRVLGLTQHELATAVGIRQTHISRLEKAGSDHLMSLYERVAARLGARLALLPDKMTLVQRTTHKR